MREAVAGCALLVLAASMIGCDYLPPPEASEGMPGTGNIRLVGEAVDFERELRLTTEQGEPGGEGHTVPAGAPLAIDDFGLAYPHGIDINGVLCDGRFVVVSDMLVTVTVVSVGPSCRISSGVVTPLDAGP